MNDDLFSMPKGIETRWASPENWNGAKGSSAQAANGRKGSPNFPLAAGESKVLAQVENSSGTLRRIWMTISDRSASVLRGLRIDIFWDGAEKPAVSAPFADFFGQGLGRCIAFDSCFFSNPEGRSFNCNIPMPFRRSMKVLLTNESDVDLRMVFYDINYTLGDPHEDDTLYFHAHWRREKETRLLNDYQFLPFLEGAGRFLGVNVGVIANCKSFLRSWWGEGEFKVYLDGDKQWPTLCGTGTEDYVGTAWGFGQYAHSYQGCHLVDRDHFQYAFYRYHVNDPIYFYKDIKVTMQQIGCWNPVNIKELHEAGSKLISNFGYPVDMEEAISQQGHGYFERQDDWSSCAYFYFDQPESKLPPLQPVEERTVGLIDSLNAKVRMDG